MSLINDMSSLTWDSSSLELVFAFIMSISDDSDRVRYNDPSLKILDAGSSYEDFYSRHSQRLEHAAHCAPTSTLDWAELGKNIGQNYHLRELYLDYGDGGEDTFEDAFDFRLKGEREDLLAFSSGLESNRSLETLHINKCNLFGRGLFDMLAPFLKNNNKLLHFTIQNDDDIDYDVPTEALLSLSLSLPVCKNLTSLSLVECDMEIDGIQHLCVGIKGCTSLRSLAIQGVNALKTIKGIQEEALGYLVEAIHGHPRLRVLKLDRNEIGWNSIALLAALLEGRDSKLDALSLQGNAITTAEAMFIAGSLAGNNTLVTLDLAGNRIFEAGIKAFLKLLCDDSTIEKTYLSNHTLQSLGSPRRREQRRPAVLTGLLALNKFTRKSYVAQQKIMGVHMNGNFGMKPFAEMNVAVLPHLLSWTNPKALVRKKLDGIRQLSVLHQIVKNMPWLMCNMEYPRQASATRGV